MYALSLIHISATEYWKIIRRRSHVDEDFQKTIALTDRSKEAEKMCIRDRAGTEHDGQLERQQTGERTHQGGRLFFVA